MTRTFAHRCFLHLLLLAAPLWLAACSSFPPVSGPLAAADEPPAPAVQESAAATPAAPEDDLALGKRYFAAGSYGLAEQHFRRAVEQSHGPRARDAEAWVGLAAAYDRLRRFDLADRAYRQALRRIGPTAEVLNNQGYSFMLRRDFKRARATLALAQKKDPGNVYIRNNLALLDESESGAAAR